MYTDKDVSLVRGSGQPALLEKTVGQLLTEKAAQFPEVDALIVDHQGIHWTYAELESRANRVACGFLRLGLRPGDRIGIWAPNCVEWLLTQLASAKVGLILVSVNPAYRVTEVEYALNKVGCRALVLARSFKSSNYVEMISQLQAEARLPHLEKVICTEDGPAGMLPFSLLMHDPTSAELEMLFDLGGKLRPEQAINIQFTSGTTGSPKGATLSHRSIVNNGYLNGEGMRLGPQDRLCIPVPLYHCFGMVLGVLACITHASTMVFPAAGFDPLETLRAVEQHRCTGLHGVPTMFIAVLRHPEFSRFNVSSLRTGIMAGAPCPQEVMQEVMDKLYMREITIAYGMTETAPSSFQCSIDDSIENRCSTVGRIHPHVEAKLIDDVGNIVPRGEKGEICVRGYNVMLCYWDEPAKTAEAIDADGWMHTGDLGVFDAEGYCSIVGRKKDMIIRGGENISPREIEEYLHKHPAVADVQCVGVFDPVYGEEICACIRLRDGVVAEEEEVRNFCKGQIAHYKVPRYVYFVPEFPTTVTGKVQKNVLRQIAEKALSLQTPAS